MSKTPPVSPWINQLAIVVFLAALVFNIIYDAVSKSYEGQPVTLALLGALSLALGYRKTLRGGDE